MAWFARRLTVLAILVGFLCLPLRATSAQQSAPVTDCSHAKTAVDRALCTTPELRAADARMAHAYLALKAGLPRSPGAWSPAQILASGSTCGKLTSHRSQRRPNAAETLGSFTARYAILYRRLKP
jgi:uncharacterized protein YecT (DUF1311 family)